MNLAIVGAYLVYASYYGGPINYARYGTSNTEIRFESRDACLIEAKKLNEVVTANGNGTYRNVLIYDCLPIITPAG